jgi:hypothetical protein
MANEITATVSLRFQKGSMETEAMTPAPFQVTVAGTYYIRQIQLIDSAAHEAIGLGEIGTPGWILAHNVSANTIQIGHDATGTFEADIKIPSGKWALFCCNQAAPYAKAATAPSALEYFLIEA